MKARLACVLVAALVSMSSVLVAKGSGGHGGGHGGGGHASGGHASGGQASGSHSQGASASTHATARTGSPSVTPATTSSGGHARNGQPIVGTAIPRASAPATIAIGTPVVIAPTTFLPYYGAFVGGGLFYSSPLLWNSYDPFLWSAYDPFYGSPTWTSSYWTPFSPSYGPGAFATTVDVASPAPASNAIPFATDGPSGGLRLEIDQKRAEVWVDGYYAGVVDDFNGTFQHLSLNVGPHRVEIRAAGYEPLGVDVIIQPRHTITYRGVLTRSPR